MTPWRQGLPGCSRVYRLQDWAWYYCDYKGEIAARREDVEEENAEIWESFEDELARKVGTIGALTVFRSDVAGFWSFQEPERPWAPLLHSPQITVGTGENEWIQLFGWWAYEGFEIMSSMMNCAILRHATAIESMSMEIVVYPFSHKDGPYPPPGTILVDADGHNRRYAHRR